MQLSDIYTYLLTDKQIDLILFIATKLDVSSFFVLIRHEFRQFSQALPDMSLLSVSTGNSLGTSPLVLVLNMKSWEN